jgi:hypothetical protein
MVRPVLGALAVLLALTSCGGDPKADSTPTPSAPVTTPVSTTPAPPVMPEAAKANTKAGAVAFVRYYVELINHAQATGEVGQLEAVEDEACTSCRAARKGVSDHYQSGGTISGGEWAIESALAVRNAAIHGWVVDTRVRYGMQTVSFGSSRPNKVNQAGEMVASFQVRWINNVWQVLEWTRGN